jgi:hypothetical protein
MAWPAAPRHHDGGLAQKPRPGAAAATVTVTGAQPASEVTLGMNLKQRRQLPVYMRQSPVAAIAAPACAMIASMAILAPAKSVALFACQCASVRTFSCARVRASAHGGMGNQSAPCRTRAHVPYVRVILVSSVLEHFLAQVKNLKTITRRPRHLFAFPGTFCGLMGADGGTSDPQLENELGNR